MTIQQIKTYLKANKITYDELSVRSGVPIGTLKHVFSGVTKNPRIDTVQAIERALELKKTPSTDKTAEPLTEAEGQLLGAYRQLVPSMQDYILEMVKKLVESQPTTGKTSTTV